MSKYLDLSIIEINKLLKEHIIKPIDLVNESFDRIDESNLNAFITVDREGAIKRAMELEKKEIDNLLFGIPIAIKDNIVTKDLKTTCASKILENFIPIYSATVVEMINEKGMIIIGKTNMDEFAMGSTSETSYFNHPFNPINREKVTGGSSGGSAACVASHIAPLSLGSDTGGSVRQPSSFCGIVGMKPTYGRVSRYGLIAFASSLDQIGPMTRNVYENALLLNAISAKDEKDLTSIETKEDFTRLINKDVSNLKVAIPSFYLTNVSKEILERIEYIKNLLISNGITVDVIDIPNLDKANMLYQIIATAEASSNLARFDGIRYGYSSNDDNLENLYKNTRSEGFGREVKRRIMVGSYILSGKNARIYYNKALSIRDDLRKNFENTFHKYDLIIGPTTTTVAYDLNKEDDPLRSFMDDVLVIPVNMAGLPALSMPIGVNNENLPIGMQIIGAWNSESLIYSLASFIERELMK